MAVLSKGIQDAFQDKVTIVALERDIDEMFLHNVFSALENQSSRIIVS